MEQPNQNLLKGLVSENPPPYLFEKRNSRAESYAIGKARRVICPREGQGSWKTFPGRRDPAELIKQSEKDRVPQLLPLRRERMSASPFTFFRASALNMAEDLASTPSSGIRVQCCGDAH